ncbi:MBL fold metallo-hydrolase [Longispora albida]|uniref:MBL fold metallo-hydrolase n=1 Tax=Longispora albida TaxID=203523 RepID=UPI00036436F3|nr:MBL fold metallo-hydrolase [Longispora albida]
MQLTKYTHACVRIEHDGGILVVDPGEWSEDEAVRGADAILVTHEHNDHFHPDRIRGLDIPIYAPEGSDLDGVPFTPLTAGQKIELTGLEIEAIGGRHALTYEDLPQCANLGYVIDGGRVYHPGDALYVPEQPIETLLVPVMAPWLKLGEAIDFVRGCKPARAFPIHDAMASDIGTTIVDRWIDFKGETDYRRLTPGQSA